MEQRARLVGRSGGDGTVSWAIEWYDVPPVDEQSDVDSQGSTIVPDSDQHGNAVAVNGMPHPEDRWNDAICIHGTDSESDDTASQATASQNTAVAVGREPSGETPTDSVPVEVTTNSRKRRRPNWYQPS